MVPAFSFSLLFPHVLKRLVCRRPNWNSPGFLVNSGLHACACVQTRASTTSTTSFLLLQFSPPINPDPDVSDSSQRCLRSCTAPHPASNSASCTVDPIDQSVCCMEEVCQWNRYPDEQQQATRAKKMPTPRCNGTLCLQLVPPCAKRGKPCGQP